MQVDPIARDLQPLKPSPGPTSAEQLHHGGRCGSEAHEPGWCLHLDLDRCSAAACAECPVQCSYPYHPGNNGVLSLRELASYALICRRCEQAHCVEACPRQALEQRPEADRLLARHLARCVGCGSCSLACPYGTIFPGLLPYLAHNCDYCLGRRSETVPPLCVTTCKGGALGLRKIEGIAAEHEYRVGEQLVVRSRHWRRDRA